MRGCACDSCSRLAFGWWCDGSLFMTSKQKDLGGELVVSNLALVKNGNANVVLLVE